MSSVIFVAIRHLGFVVEYDMAIPQKPSQIPDRRAREPEATMVRAILPQHLQVLANAPREVRLEIHGPVTCTSILQRAGSPIPDALRHAGDHVTQKCRALVRFFACQEDVSNDPADKPLPQSIASGEEAFYIIGAIAGG